MRITKRQLRRIIKEERLKLEGFGDEVNKLLHDSLFQILDQELDRMGVDRYGTPSDAQNVANALEKIAGTVRSEGGVG
jgi:hypothetical protein